MRGANPASLLNVIQDLGVKNTVAFHGGAWISEGTADGLRRLEEMTDEGVALKTFLTSKAASNATLVFAGHSLGGALAPTLALDLAINRGFDLTKWANVFVYPTAAATPGNEAFHDLFERTFPAQQPAGAEPWNVWNMDVVNHLDPVPEAWNQLRTLPTLYPLPAVTQFALQGCIDRFITAGELNKNIYAILPTSRFHGQLEDSPPPAPFVNFAPKFFDQAYYQHIRGYIKAIIPELAPVFEQHPVF